MRNRKLFTDLIVSDPANTPRLSIPQFLVHYWKEDGTLDYTEYVVPMPYKGGEGQSDLKDLILLQEKLLEYCVFKTAAIGSLLCDAEPLSIINQMAKMLKVVGKKERGINIGRMLGCGDYLQIAQIFLSEGCNNDEIVPADYTPSAIARIHRMDFVGKLREYSEKRRKQILAEEIDRIESEIEIEIVEPEPKIEPTPTPIDTPPPVLAATTST